MDEDSSSSGGDHGDQRDRDDHGDQRDRGDRRDQRDRGGRRDQRGPTTPTASGATDPVGERIELGVELLAHLEHEELSLKEVIDRVETITIDPAVTREILDTAELRGIIDREDGMVRPTSHSYVSMESDVVQREGEFTCRRCGASLSTGHFIALGAGELGPFGSSCIRKVTGRE